MINVGLLIENNCIVIDKESIYIILYNGSDSFLLPRVAIEKLVNVLPNIINTEH